MPQSHSEPKVIKIRLCNSLAVDRELWLEPLGDVVQIPVGRTVEIVLEEHSGDVPEIDITDTAFLIHGWVQRVSSIEDDGSATLIWPSP